MKLRSSLLALAAIAAVPAALFAQSQDGDVSRAPDGRILHRRTLDPGDTPVADTPVFVYEPGASGGLPKDVVRDGVTLPRPTASTDRQEGELIHTAGGLDRPRPEAPRAPEPLAAPPPNAPHDPSAPLPPTPLPGDDADAEVVIDLDASPEGEAIEGDGGTPSAAATDATPAPTSPTDADTTESAEPSEPVDDPRASLGSEAHPDRDTAREGTLHYNEVFDPSVVPFKRNRALDSIGEDFVLRVAPGRMERLEPVGNRLERGREVFWGSLLLEGTAGERIPIPSVSPEGRILSYQATPPQKVVFERDGAGNFYATPALDGRLRLVFVTDAPSHWFGRPLPRELRLEDVPRALRPKVPRAVQREGLEVASAIGVSAAMEYGDALDRLVAYFRAFEPGEPPPAVGSVYKDIALGRRGICRHRGHAFVITAQALGIPARYVFNEAHVFVEVYIAGASPGWMRVDLGGGAEELQVHGAEGKQLHRPVGGDPFDKPPGFAGSEAAGAMRTSGMPDAPGDTTAGPLGLGADAPLAPALEGPIARARPAPGLVPTRTTIELGESLVFRGDAVHVSGQVATARGGPIASGTVQILLTTAAGEAVALLGTASVAAGGFAVDVAIPPGQSPGQYEIVAEFLGDGVHAPSVGQ